MDGVRLSKAVQQFHKLARGQDSYAFVILQDGQILVSSDDQIGFCCNGGGEHGVVIGIPADCFRQRNRFNKMRPLPIRPQQWHVIRFDAEFFMELVFEFFEKDFGNE